MDLSKNPTVIQAQALAAECTTVDQLYQAMQDIDPGALVKDRRIVRSERTSVEKPIMLMGKTPAATEIETGKFFQGPAGQVLRRALKDAGQDIGDYHLINASAWRPRKDNLPTPTQLAISRPFTMREIELVKPRRIIALGAKVCDTLFGDHPDMVEDLEQTMDLDGIEVVVIRNHGLINRQPKLYPAFVETLGRWGYGQARSLAA